MASRNFSSTSRCSSRDEGFRSPEFEGPRRPGDRRLARTGIADGRSARRNGARVAITARKKEELEQATKHLEKQGIVAASFVWDMGKRGTIRPVPTESLK